jgi:DNA-binding GntR family transcriptional regulator
MEASMQKLRSSNRRSGSPSVATVLPPPTYAEQAYAQLKDALIVGRFVPGQHVTLRSLCAQFGTSVTPVREALLRLSSASALECHGYRDIRIPVLSAADLDELQYMRVSLESLALRETDGAFRKTEALMLLDRLRAASEAADAIAFSATVKSLRALLLRLDDYPVLAPLIDRVWCRLGPTFARALANYSVRRHVAANFADLADAMERQDFSRAKQTLEWAIPLPGPVLSGNPDRRH